VTPSFAAAFRSTLLYPAQRSATNNPSQTAETRKAAVGTGQNRAGFHCRCDNERIAEIIPGKVIIARHANKNVAMFPPRMQFTHDRTRPDRIKKAQCLLKSRRLSECTAIRCDAKECQFRQYQQLQRFVPRVFFPAIVWPLCAAAGLGGTRR
jgi:hypothetical protein